MPPIPTHLRTLPARAACHASACARRALPFARSLAWSGVCGFVGMTAALVVGLAPVAGWLLGDEP